MFTIMGIDSGTNHLGGAALSVNTREPKPFKLIYADTLRGDLNDFSIIGEKKSGTKAKGLIRAYEYLLSYLNPGVVCCEDNFLGFKKSPVAFKRLIEIVTMMGYCTLTNKPEVPFNLVLPRLAKQIVGADFVGSTKDDVRDGLLKCDLIDFNGFNLSRLSEHANDAILVALYEAVQLYKSYGWIIKDENTKIFHFSQAA